MCGKPLILAPILLDLKIIVSHDGSSSVCYKLFVELEKAFAFTVGSAVEEVKESAPRTSTRERYSARKISEIKRAQREQYLSLSFNDEEDNLKGVAES